MTDDNQTTEVTFARGRDLPELKKAVEDLIEQGWMSEGPVIENADGTFSRKMVKTKQ